MSEIKEIGVVGYPSKLGGADTELDHQIRCWSKMGIKVHLCHTGYLDKNLLAMKMDNRGCIIHTPKDWASLEGMHVISFCNGGYLDNIQEIKKYAKTTSFVNCMTWNFPKEIKAQTEGSLDFHLYQSDHQFKKVSVKLQKLQNYRPIRFQPYFHAEDFKYKDNRSNYFFNFGRISRGDADKYGQNQLWIYRTMTAPVLKKGTMLGWDDRAKKKFEAPPDWIKTYPEGGITQQQFYDTCDVIIMQTKTFENMPRVGMEAMASGSVLVVDNRGGWRCLVENGKTGWLCDNERDFVYKASRIAHEIQEKEDMRGEAKKKLEKNWGIDEAMKSWENVFKQWESLA